MTDRYIPLEEGVDWDTKKKVLRPTNTYMAGAMDRADTASRAKTGLVLGVEGALVGAAYGLNSRWNVGLPGLAGAAIGGGLGYALGGVKRDPVTRKITRDRILEKLEKQYQNRIDEIEGW